MSDDLFVIFGIGIYTGFIPGLVFGLLINIGFGIWDRKK